MRMRVYFIICFFGGWAGLHATCVVFLLFFSRDVLVQTEFELLQDWLSISICSRRFVLKELVSEVDLEGAGRVDLSEDLSCAAARGLGRASRGRADSAAKVPFEGSSTSSGNAKAIIVALR